MFPIAASSAGELPEIRLTATVSVYAENMYSIAAVTPARNVNSTADFIILFFRDVRMTVIFIILFRMNVLYNILFGDVRKYAGCEQYGLTYTFIII